MSVEKSLNLPPVSILTLAANEPDEMEIQIVHEGDEMTPDTAEPVDQKSDFDDNLAETIEDSILSTLTADLLKEIEQDIAARKDWEEMYKDGVKLLGLRIEERTEPWQGACGVFHPMITEAVIRFQSDTMTETFPASGPVKTQIIGRTTTAKEEAAERVKDDLNWQLTENMREFRGEHEKAMFGLPGAGSAFKKIYFDGMLGRQTSVFVDAEHVLLPYSYTDMFTCERITHVMFKSKADVRRMQVDGFWCDVDLGEPIKTVNNSTIKDKKDKESGVSARYDNRYKIYEINVDIDFDSESLKWKDVHAFEDGVPCPYVITIESSTQKILSVRRNWRENDYLKLKRQHFVHYEYIPGFGAYGFGLFHLIGGYAKAATSIMRQLVDAGTLNNLPGGLKTRGLRIKGDDVPIAPGEWRDVDLGSGGIKDNIMALPYKEPSQVLAGLLDKIIDDGRRLAASGDMKISDMSNKAPVGTTLALIERTLKVMTAIQARVHHAFRQELRLIAEIIKDYTEETDGSYDYEVEATQGSKAKLSDYSICEIIPVSDPNAATMSQRVVQYQAVLALSQTAPQIYDMPELHRQMLHVLGIKHIDKLVPSEEDLKLTDPVQENQNLLHGKPVKAFPEQDHHSHIIVHRSAMEDPLIMQIIGQNPKAPVIMAAAQAHLAEHVGYAYRNQMQAALGMPLPDKEHPLDIGTERQLSQMLARAAPTILNHSKQIAAQNQAQKNAQDPVLQAQLIDKQVKQGELQRKGEKDKADFSIAQGKLQLEAQKAGIDPQSQQLNNANMQQTITLAAVKAQQEESRAQDRAQQQSEAERIRLSSQLSQQYNQAQIAKRSADVTNNIAIDRHQNDKQMQQQKHREQLRQKAEAHKAAIKAKVEEANKPKFKGGGH